MANEWTKERQANAKDSLDKLGWPLTETETRAALAEIERARGEIEALCGETDRDSVTQFELRQAETINALVSERDEWKRTAEMRQARMLHAHDSANAQNKAVQTLLANAMQQAYGESDHYTVSAAAIDALRATVDPAFQAAALAEAQRRDGLDEQVKRLTGALLAIKHGNPEPANLAGAALLGWAVDPAYLARVAGPETAEQASVQRAACSDGCGASEDAHCWNTSDWAEPPPWRGDLEETPTPEMVTTTGEETGAETVERWAREVAAMAPKVERVTVRTTGDKPAWLTDAVVKWQEDDAGTRDRERIEAAWQRVYRMPLPTGQPFAIHDAGDTFYRLYAYGQILVNSYQGDAIMQATPRAWAQFIGYVPPLAQAALAFLRWVCSWAPPCECDPSLPSSRRCDGAWIRCNKGLVRRPVSS